MTADLQTSYTPSELCALWRQHLDAVQTGTSWTVAFANDILRRAVADGQFGPGRDAAIAEATFKACHAVAVKNSAAAAHAMKQGVRLADVVAGVA